MLEGFYLVEHVKDDIGIGTGLLIEGCGAEGVARIILVRGPVRENPNDQWGLSA